MKTYVNYLFLLMLSFLLIACGQPEKEASQINAKDILGNPEYLAFSYGGYREKTRDVVPTVEQLKEDMKILSAMGIKLLRTYNTSQYQHAANLLKAIHELKKEDPDFEMYVMLGVWIECEGAWTDQVNHKAGNIENNTAEIIAAIEMVNTYPDIVKIIAVGNEAMVHWAATYFVTPDIILKWVNHLQELKKTGEIPADIWITSSDNYESWGGGAKSYHTDDLTALIEAVDFVSLHTYPFHDSHYNPEFWGVPPEQESLSDLEKIDAAMLRAKNYAISQYQTTADYIKSLGIEKEIHIGETGWASICGSLYGPTGAKAADEYKEKLYYEHMRDWTNEAGMSCFYFEAFDEQWKDSANPMGSENHFGLINLKGEAKYALWDMVDQGVFDGLTRDGKPITKTYNGDKAAMMADVLTPPLKTEMGILEITTINEERKTGDKITEGTYLITPGSLVPDGKNDATYPSSVLKLNPWEGTCSIEMSYNGVVEIATGAGEWWGCAIEVKSGEGENLSNFSKGHLHFEIKGDTKSTFRLGFQTGLFSAGNQVNNFVRFGKGKKYKVSDEWTKVTIPVESMNKGADLTDVTGLLYLRGEKDFDGKYIYLREIYYSKK